MPTRWAKRILLEAKSATSEIAEVALHFSLLF